MTLRSDIIFILCVMMYYLSKCFVYFICVCFTCVMFIVFFLFVFACCTVSVIAPLAVGSARQ
jgi:hypothetical protein